MDLNEYLNRLSWKKILLIIGSAFLVLTMIKEMLVLTVFNQTFQSVNQTIQHQQNKLESIRKNFTASDKNIHQMTEDTFARVDKTIAHAHDSLENIGNTMEDSK